MPFFWIFLAACFWFWWQMTRPVKTPPRPPVKPKADPFADHPMHCKCTFHR